MNLETFRLSEQSAARLIELLGGLALKVVGVLLALLVAWRIAGWLRGRTERQLLRAKVDSTLARFFGQAVRYTVIVGAVLGCLGAVGIETASFAAAFAAAGLAVGLAFQGTLSNFAAGAMLLIFRPLRIGDFVSAAGEMGTVAELGIFTTELKAIDGKRVILPNSAVFGNTITNFTDTPLRRVDVAVGVEYSADIDRTRQVLEEAVASVPGKVSEPAPQVFLSGLGASSVDWQLRLWAEPATYWDVHQASVRAAKVALDKAGIGIPFPQLDVHLGAEQANALLRKAS